MRVILYHVPCALSIIFTALEGSSDRLEKEKNVKQSMAHTVKHFFLTKQISSIQ